MKAHWSRVLEMLPLKCLTLKWSINDHNSMHYLFRRIELSYHFCLLNYIYLYLQTSAHMVWAEVHRALTLLSGCTRLCKYLPDNLLKICQVIELIHDLTPSCDMYSCRRCFPMPIPTARSSRQLISWIHNQNQNNQQRLINYNYDFCLLWWIRTKMY